MHVVPLHAGAACNDTTYDYPVVQHQEESGAIEMTENPAYAAVSDYYNLQQMYFV